jgi:N-acetylglucosaminyldiphosphoundecaprenol N-acetyl-beta-D-mannosaminyltransferase
VTSASKSSRVPILGTGISALTFEEACDGLLTLVENRIPAYVSPATVFSVTLGYDNPDYRSIPNRAIYVTPDGMPLVWLLRALGHRVERVHNDDLFLVCCERFRGWRHFLVGGRDGQPDQVAAELTRRYPGIQIVGSHATPQRPVPFSETRRIAEEVAATRPDIVWAALGTPAQDFWMRDAMPLINLPMCGVGSVFDLLAGRTRPAPEWVKRNGLQWLFRFCQEPRRLAGRYIKGNSRFLAALALGAVRGRIGDPAR